ncbi:glutamate receptor ionotropic, nmda 3a [Plakobranchus ocellatus]|uniref:Glutamate receptor ionotropic, nmda 3a n=1 Tax=Plakobranchus ocellatus TaxID=259542 RepID=A0AAV3XRE9_9GAST|nr:glutamate receptor ionotropic, nmda 3a [Plakobranchus ocellatus]
MCIPRHRQQWDKIHKRLLLCENIQGRTYTSLNPSPEAQGRALTQVIGEFNMKQTAVIVEDTRLADGFLSGVRQAINARRQDIFYLMPLAADATGEVILDKLIDLSNTGWKVILLHASPSLMLKVVTSALSTRLYKTGHAWFLSEAAFSRDESVLQKLPDGLLAIDSFWLGGLSDVMATSLERGLDAITCLLNRQSNTVPFANQYGGFVRNRSNRNDNVTPSNDNIVMNDRTNYSNINNVDRLERSSTYKKNKGNLSYLDGSIFTTNKTRNSSSDNSTTNETVVTIASLRASIDFANSFKRCLNHVYSKIHATNSNRVRATTPTDALNRTTDIYDAEDNIDSRRIKKFPSSNRQFGFDDNNFDNSNNTDDDKLGDVHKRNGRMNNVTKSQSLTGPAFFLLNTIRDYNGSLMWSKVGYITASGDRDLRTVLWPGHNIYGPSSNSIKTYKVVTRPAEPFIYITGQVSAKEECMNNVPCLQLQNSTKRLVEQAVEDFETHLHRQDELYTIHCCKGLSLEMLDRLSIDLNFRYVLYFVNDTNYGTFVDGVWTGMVGDVVNDVADVAIGAFSMTAERMAVLDFTEPFYQNEFALITGEDGIYVSIWAFMSPFSGQVWLCIMLSSIVAGIATSILEWHSPFGLNPKGRKRTKNYGLGSGLLMVMVLLTGHTINVKAPKSWPGKVIQNVWAGMAIFIMTSYTANLAAYLAGQSAVTTVNSVFDPELLAKKVAVIPSSAVEYFVDRIHPKLGAKAKLHAVSSTKEAINLLK